MIEKLLDKPEHHRQKVAYLATFVIGVMIFSAWLVIANFNVKQAFNPAQEEENKVAQDFKNSLPSLRQSESVTTELMKGNTAATQGQEQQEEKEEKKPWWKFW